jgi:hypothetical protein
VSYLLRGTPRLITAFTMPDTIDFATYFVERLKQCGVRYVFGVPGDYNLEL